MRIIGVVAGATLALGTSSVLAGDTFKSGNELHEQCQDHTSPAATIYVMGVWDAYSALEELEGFETGICPPKGVSMGQMEDIVCTWLLQHPEDRHHAASSLALNALHQSFPCAN
ncbi:Rap1a/Tai family immunity protein [Paracoccus sp. PAR01]|uniref:Rap1a/Tai family immunity protein n=1 Tax=Paracoccus sp. PAR01 TaxID=2769282 RepID=UPI00177C466B|nr:Rap1a/Tai family immunity protein [Paracoccus sp. PAR01]MBD9528399.1 hypothetical protein [Paracoccus sp. PAR01]